MHVNRFVNIYVKQDSTKWVAVVAPLPGNFSEKTFLAGNFIEHFFCQEIWGNIRINVCQKGWGGKKAGYSQVIRKHTKGMFVIN